VHSRPVCLTGLLQSRSPSLRCLALRLHVWLASASGFKDGAWLRQHLSAAASSLPDAQLAQIVKESQDRANLQPLALGPTLLPALLSAGEEWIRQAPADSTADLLLSLWTFGLSAPHRELARGMVLDSVFRMLDYNTTKPPAGRSGVWARVGDKGPRGCGK
jgi:hypothetical protein